MFSYLHGVRPSNRRPAISATAAPEPDSEKSFFHDSPSSPGFRFDLSPQHDRQPSGGSRDGALSEHVSPVATAPPVLPPIDRIASQGNSGVNQSEEGQEAVYGLGIAENQDHSSQNEPSKRTDHPRPNTSHTMSTHEREDDTDTPKPMVERPKSSQMAQPTRRPPEPPSNNEPIQRSSRPKRPIDVAFENMRSYSEPPFRQSIMMPLRDGSMPSQPYQQKPRITPSRPSTFAYHTQGFPSSQSQPSSQVRPLSSGSKQTFQLWGNRTSPQTSQNIPSKSKSQAPALTSYAQDLPTSTAKTNKSRLNLRNPLSLLARRRSSQVVAEAYSQSHHVPAVPLRDDFDPRIRGKVVHDFSAPRSGRVQGPGASNLAGKAEETEHDTSDQKKPSIMFSASPGTENRNSAERDHAPIFKEHFDDGPVADPGGPAKRRSAAFMSQVSSQESQPKPDRSSLPVFARNLPVNFASSMDNLRQTSSPTPTKAPLEPVLESSDTVQSPETTPPKSASKLSVNSSPPITPPITRSRGSSINDQSLQGIGSPKRFKSNASRFSFDLAGLGSAAQEKLLEEKHRQHANRKQRDSVMSLEDGEEMSDDNGYDEYMREEMEGDDFEEKIPGVNVDEIEMPGSQLPMVESALESVHIASPNKSSFQGTTSPVSTGLTSPGTSCDLNGQAVEFSMSSFSGGVKQVQVAGDGNLRPRSTPENRSHSGLPSEPLQRVVSSDSNLASLPKRDSSLMGLHHHLNEHDLDDLYFEEGFDDEDLNVDGDETFDESVFDDSSHGLYGLPLRDRTLRPLDSDDFDNGLGLGKISPIDDSAQGTAESLLSSQQSVKSSSGFSNELRDALTELAQPNRPTFSHTAGLTKDNLAAYNQNDLALAAMQAAQNGKFNRSNSIASRGAESDPDGIPLDVTRTGSQMSMQPPEISVQPSFVEDADDDDDIVAAANAEALENDDDGFYGQEFGFFAGPAPGNDEADYANGGYFGSRSLPEGVHRSHSGRDAGFQEPSLTPITERSEWSNRNSTISLAHWGHPLSSPGFGSEVQLANMMNLPEDGMTLEALMKLRRTAFGGGSSTSLHSSSNSNSNSNISPAATTTLAPGTAMATTGPLQQDNTVLTINSSDTQNPSTASFHSDLNSSIHGGGQASSPDNSDPSSSGESPTITFSPPSAGLTMASPLLPPPPMPMGPPPLPPSKGLKKPSPPPPIPKGPPPLPPLSSDRAAAAAAEPQQPQPSGQPAPVPSLPPIQLPQQDISPKRRSTIVGKDRSPSTAWTPSSSGHSRNSSGAESVSYKEEGGKWILEKTRVSDDGELEVVGRAVVEGGRI